ncbi:LAMI_0G04874g1_1 [Lachancea mirantina]|uniref:Alkyl transferase n=1 Tax=Lachancea mirantina TaxID=1230905 RepID=A0A1G4K8Q1_9SACH|nr:LAMI_0G04874g1_1 [Lachancea mirantina]
MVESNNPDKVLAAIETEIQKTKEHVKREPPKFPNPFKRGEIKPYLRYRKTQLFKRILAIKLVHWTLASIETCLINVLKMGPLPQHVSFIMDGNRRYAKSMGLPIKRGHEAGAVTLLELLSACKKLGIQVISAYAFSIENFNRPQEEVDTLTRLLAEKLDEVARRAQDHKNELYGLRLRVVGERSLISKHLDDKITRVERMTEEGQEMTLYICFPYTSRNDIYHAIYNSAEKCKYFDESTSDITAASLTKEMFFNEYSDKCDLLIRTSGHTRLSDYMLWQVHQDGVIEFSNTLWPDFSFLEFFIILLRWSFFTTMVRAVRNQLSVRRHVFHFAKSHFFPTKKNYANLDTLPDPPQAISVIERS